MPGTSGSKYDAYWEKALRAAGMVLGNGLATAGLRVNAEAERLIDDLCYRNELDVIVGRFTRTSAAAGLLSKRQLPLIIDADDWELSRTHTRIRSTSKYRVFMRLFLKLELRGNKFLTDKLLQLADHIWLASEEDTDEIGCDYVTTLSNLPVARDGGSIQALGPSLDESRIVFSVGDWGKTQNSDGMNWYLRQVWPAIRQRAPQAELRIAGTVPEHIARGWAGTPNVKLLGFVDDLRSEYEGAASVATPIIWGGGTKIKVLEALAFGRVPTGTVHAFKGLADARQLASISAIEDDAGALAEATAALFFNPTSRHAREEAAAQYFMRNYSILAFNQRVADTLRSVVSRSER